MAVHRRLCARGRVRPRGAGIFEPHPGGERRSRPTGLVRWGVGGLTAVCRPFAGQSGGACGLEFAYDLLDQYIETRLDGAEPIRHIRDALGQLTREEFVPGLARELNYNADALLTGQRTRAGQQTLFATDKSAERRFIVETACKKCEKRMKGRENDGLPPPFGLARRLNGVSGRLKAYLVGRQGDENVYTSRWGKAIAHKT